MSLHTLSDPLLSGVDTLAKALRDRAGAERPDWVAACYTRHGAPHFVPRHRAWVFTTSDAHPILRDGSFGDAVRTFWRLGNQIADDGGPSWVSCVLGIWRSSSKVIFETDTSDRTRWRVDDEDPPQKAWDQLYVPLFLET